MPLHCSARAISRLNRTGRARPVFALRGRSAGRPNAPKGRRSAGTVWRKDILLTGARISSTNESSRRTDRRIRTSPYLGTRWLFGPVHFDSHDASDAPISCDDLVPRHGRRDLERIPVEWNISGIGEIVGAFLRGEAGEDIAEGIP
jgi:hypothetical protein